MNALSLRARRLTLLVSLLGAASLSGCGDDDPTTFTYRITYNDSQTSLAPLVSRDITLGSDAPTVSAPFALGSGKLDARPTDADHYVLAILDADNTVKLKVTCQTSDTSSGSSSFSATLADGGQYVVSLTTDGVSCSDR